MESLSHAGSKRALLVASTEGGGGVAGAEGDSRVASTKVGSMLAGTEGGSINLRPVLPLLILDMSYLNPSSTRRAILTLDPSYLY